MSSRRIAVRRSGVHGKGVFATEPIAAGERLIEYKGERISWKEALRRHPHNPDEPNHTFYFALDSGKVIDGKVDGNSISFNVKRNMRGTDVVTPYKGIVNDSGDSMKIDFTRPGRGGAEPTPQTVTAKRATT